MAPVLSIVGRSGSGKTTLLEALITELTSRGIKVGAIKHDAHRFDIDHEGKDSYRLFHAGARSVIIASAEKFALVSRLDSERSLDGLIPLLGEDLDLVLTEGYKGATGQKIEVTRAANTAEIILSDEQVVARVSDLKLDTSVPLFHLDDVMDVADFIQESYVSRTLAPDSSASLAVDRSAGVMS